jgi:hypothetical protein
MIDADGVLRGPAGGGRIAWISRSDSARVIAEILPKPPGGILTYTGPEALTLAETATRLSVLLGRRIRCEDENPRGGESARRRDCGEDRRAARGEPISGRARTGYRSRRIRAGARRRSIDRTCRAARGHSRVGRLALPAPLAPAG